MSAARALRDTDADWRELGATQPYWGVLTHADYRTENLTPANLEAFYASGQQHIADVAGRLGQCASCHGVPGQDVAFAVDHKARAGGGAAAGGFGFAEGRKGRFFRRDFRFDESDAIAVGQSL